MSDPLEWFELYGDYLFAFALRRVREESAAEDIVQETFLAAIQSNNSYAGKSAEKTWLTGILKHKIYDFFKKNSPAAEITAEEADLSSYNYMFERTDEWDGHWNDRFAPADWENESPLRHVEEGEFQIVFGSCLENLPERIANAFVMREVDGLESAEICGVLQISTNNYWTMMHRARLHLRRCIEVNWFTAAAPNRADL
ncbi:MAG: sigma-70 family RNA polymerase sigma factor [Pyrinomonadaceae bacterium]|nr:sigma-70 family RNA polymerase sigma factor [Pyrinomonadaceae bacterium]